MQGSNLIVGYARVSTVDQNLNLQVDALKKAGCHEIYEEVISGVHKNKKELEKALSKLRKGDTFIVWRLDRLGRTLQSLLHLVNDLRDKGIQFKSLQDTIDTSTPMGQFFFHVTGSFAELERHLIHERTMAGLKASSDRGIKGGRPKILTGNKESLRS